VKPGYEINYSLMELRNHSRLIVRRQLFRNSGVVEVTAGGVYSSNYEVAIKSEQLAAKKYRLPQVMDALEKNNSVAGGGYIGKSQPILFYSEVMALQKHQRH